MSYFSGKVNNIIYADPEQAFYVLVMRLDDETDQAESRDLMAFLEVKPKHATVRGYVPGLLISIGTWFGFEAKWHNHQKFGRQLAITKAPILKDGWNPDTAEKVLVSNGVGEQLCQQIRDHFGDEEFLEALGDPKRLEEVEEVSEFAALYVAERWESVLAHFRALEFLNNIGVPRNKIRQVWELFQDQAEKVLSKDPWALVRVPGITFQDADAVARGLGIDIPSPQRTKGAVLYACKGQRSFGHVYLRTGPLAAAVSQMAGYTAPSDIAKAMQECHKEGSLVLDRETRPSTLAIYEPWMFHLESVSAQSLKERLVTASAEEALDPEIYKQALLSVGPQTEAAVAAQEPLLSVIEAAVEEWGSMAHLTLSQAQRQGVVNALYHPVSILTGLPGTGKTTSLRAVVRILQDAGVEFLLCAPTGIAAKRLKDVTGAEASTIHRAFGAMGGDDQRREANYIGITGSASVSGDAGEHGLWGFDPENPHPARVVIVDEASMVDQHLLYRLLTCTSKDCRLVFVGDHAQLPSVGPGNVLRNLIESDEFPVIKLTEIFRQKGTSSIVYAAHAIHDGDVPQTGGDFALLELGSEEEVLDAICSLAVKLYDKNDTLEADEKKTFQILSPRHKGLVGVTHLNARLRELLNPRQPGVQEIQMGGDTIRERDRVMVVKNNYEKGVFNGDVGRIVRIDRRHKTVWIKIFGAPPLQVEFKYKEIPRFIRLAYACTVHKAQGLEYDIIIMPLVDSFHHQLQRNLFYTAVTRAKKRVFLVGSRSALARSVFNDKEDLRDTLLVERLRLRSAGGLSAVGLG